MQATIEGFSGLRRSPCGHFAGNSRVAGDRSKIPLGYRTLKKFSP